MKVLFATSNKNKFKEAKAVLSKYGIKVEMLKKRKLEIQSNSIKEIAKHSALELFKEVKSPLITEDSELTINALKGFPGPYSAYVFKTIGNKGILKLMKNKRDRRSVFKAAVYFCSFNIQKCFIGVAKGKIAFKEKGCLGFGFDPIFIPNECSNKTFGEMLIEEKSLYSHRGKAMVKFAKWYIKNYKEEVDR
ncbi:XTP/dITP diphosphatase [Candidatus Bathyarchaeota archaeon]|nr:XTP/dITP diphosphatase [Candidatus Bathyarchaeota archaeon]